ncbi:MAG: ABC transporter permease subunit [Candidatus Ornithomonoglobus sp.]
MYNRLFFLSSHLLHIQYQLFLKHLNYLKHPYKYVFSEVWQGVGWGSIIYMAPLTNIDSSLYEAAMIDGANRWRQTIHVTIPGIIPTIVTLLIMQLGKIMSLGFEKIILIYNPTTLETAETISTYVYSKGLVDMDYSYATFIRNLFPKLLGVCRVSSSSFSITPPI